MKKLRISIVNNLYPPQMIGGYERAIADYARILHDRGHHVLVLTSNAEEYAVSSIYADSDPPVRRCLSLCGGLKDEGAYFFPPEIVASLTVQNLKIIEQELQAFQPQVCLVGNLAFLGIELVEFILANSIPVAHYVMDPSLYYFAEQKPLSHLHQYITCSDWVRQRLQQLGCPVETARTIYPGAAVEEFYQAELPPRDRLRIAYASLVMEHKGADVLIEALSFLHSSDVKFTATIAGGSYQPEFVQALQEFVDSEGLHEQIKFVGVLSRQELKEIYRTHNVLVFPSKWAEPFGISQIEAMAAGLTLVTSGTGGAGEIVENGEDGLIFESENPLDLANILSSLPESPTDWERITRCGQERAMSEFSQTKTVEQLELVFRQLIADN